jgi:hypothetical protein
VRGHGCIGLLALACVLAGCGTASSRRAEVVPPRTVNWSVTKSVPALKVVDKRFVITGPRLQQGESHVDMIVAIGEGNGDHKADLDVQWHFSTPSGAYTRTIHAYLFGRTKLVSESIAQALNSGYARRYPVNRGPAHWFSWFESRNAGGFASREDPVKARTADDVTHLDYQCGEDQCGQYWAASKLTLSGMGFSYAYGEDWSRTGALLLDHALSAATVVGGFEPRGRDAVVFTSASGTRLFAWQNGRVATASLDLRPNQLLTPQAPVTTPLVGDLNGDGRDEIVGWAGLDDLIIFAPAN